jgi:hypothetical protein
MYKQAQDIPIRPPNPETLPGSYGLIKNQPDSLPLPEEIQFEQAYSADILRHLQATEEGIIGSQNARGRLMKDMDLSHEAKGVRIHVSRSLEELKDHNLIQVIGDRNQNPTRIKSIIPTELGFAYQLPPATESKE